jgi:hypothetical protein
MMSGENVEETGRGLLQGLGLWLKLFLYFITDYL